MTTRTLLLLAALALPIGGCAPWVNIPAQTGDAASHDPNLETVQEVAVVAIKAAIADSPVASDKFQVIMPKGTLPATYELITPKISPNAMWSTDAATSGLPTVEVRRLSIRGSDAEVDVLRPMEPGSPVPQVLTVTLSWDAVSSWQADRVKVWRVRAGEAMRTTPSDAPPQLQR
ncbi:MAG: hypothetical protein K8S99_08800 [Planctomycetes bacterium]|nr:hypothetical protein [Planctomycetota bacterium]